VWDGDITSCSKPTVWDGDFPNLNRWDGQAHRVGWRLSSSLHCGLMFLAHRVGWRLYNNKFQPTVWDGDFCSQLPLPVPSPPCGNRNTILYRLHRCVPSPPCGMATLIILQSLQAHRVGWRLHIFPTSSNFVFQAHRVGWRLLLCWT
jgi:hypothetical protein